MKKGIYRKTAKLLIDNRTNLKKLNGFKLDSLLDRRYERLIEIGK